MSHIMRAGRVPAPGSVPTNNVLVHRPPTQSFGVAMAVRILHREAGYDTRDAVSRTLDTDAILRRDSLFLLKKFGFW
jgi:hypothetical protein